MNQKEHNEEQLELIKHIQHQPQLLVASTCSLFTVLYVLCTLTSVCFKSFLLPVATNR